MPTLKVQKPHQSFCLKSAEEVKILPPNEKIQSRICNKGNNSPRGKDRFNETFSNKISFHFDSGLSSTVGG